VRDRVTLSARIPIALIAALSLAVLIIAGATSAAADTTPSVTLAPPSPITYTSAQLKGTVNPNGGPSETFWHFEYSPTGAEGSFNQVGPGGELTGTDAEGTTPVPVEEALTGLEAGKTYYVRLVATNEFEGNRAVVSRSFSTEFIAPPTVSIAPPSAITGTGAHLSGEMNPEGTDPAFAVHWHFQCTPGCPGLEGDIPPGTTGVPVEADATGLLPGTKYQVNLIAKNAGEPIGAGPETFTTQTIAPQVSGASASANLSEAEVTAQVNSGGEATTYRVEYGPTAAYGSSTPAKTLPAKATAQSVAVKFGGLAEGTTYHARLVATNSHGSAQSADLAFNTQAREAASGGCSNEAIRIEQDSTYLPDCRAYEMVSPANKEGGGVNAFPTGFPTELIWQPTISRVAPSGEAATYWSYQAFADSRSANVNSYRSVRGATGWETQSVIPAFPGPGINTANGKILVQGSTPELSKFFLYTAVALDPRDKVPNSRDLYGITPGGQPVWESGPDGLEGTLSGPAAAFVAVSSDGSRAFFEAERELVPEAAGLVPGREILYERSEGHTRMVGLDSAGEPISECGSIPGNDQHPPDGGEVQQRETSNGYFIGPDNGAVSADGSRVYITSPDPSYTSAPDPVCEAQVPEVYLRAGGQTVEVSRSRRATPDPESLPATFVAAGDSGSIAYFSSDEALTENASLNANGMLYAYEAEGDRLRLVAPEGFEQVITSSSDGTRLYYVRDNGLYVYSTKDDQSRFIAPAEGLEKFSGAELATAITPSGSRFLFQSRGNLTGFDSRGFLEVYLYDAISEQLTCVSCVPGRPPTADSDLPPVASSNLQLFNSQPRPRNLSQDGTRVFFQTNMPLVARDVNAAADVYEWYDGNLSLVSDGRAAEGSRYFGASASGRDVFIVTPASLVKADGDGDVDVYDVRSGGGFTEPPSAVPCAGEACQGASAATSPPAVSPSSTSSNGSVSKASIKPKKKKHKAKHKKKQQHKKKSGSGHNSKRKGR
jgi:hypothetical protein